MELGNPFVFRLILSMRGQTRGLPSQSQVWRIWSLSLNQTAVPADKASACFPGRMLCFHRWQWSICRAPEAVLKYKKSSEIQSVG